MARSEAGEPGDVAAEVAAPAGVPACDRCGGTETVKGTLALPLLGRALFAYRLATQSIETEVDARMCARCGAISFTAADPARILRAAAADRLARRA